MPGTGTTTTRYVSHEATIRAWLRRALAEVATSAPADISRLASYTVRPSPSGDNGLSAGRSKHTANGAEPQFHVLVVNQSITSCGAVMTWRSVPGGSAPGSSRRYRYQPQRRAFVSEAVGAGLALSVGVTVSVEVTLSVEVTVSVGATLSVGVTAETSCATALAASEHALSLPSVSTAVTATL